MPDCEIWVRAVDNAGNASGWSKGRLAVSSISLTGATVGLGQSATITASISPSNASNKNITWSSSNTSVVTVNSSGVVTGVGNGSATITAAKVSSYVRLTGTAIDESSGVVGYKWTTTSTQPTSWTSVTRTYSTVTVNKNVTSVGTHYFWTKDYEGNVSMKKAIITKHTHITSCGKTTTQCTGHRQDDGNGHMKCDKCGTLYDINDTGRCPKIITTYNCGYGNFEWTIE